MKPDEFKVLKLVFAMVIVVLSYSFCCMALLLVCVARFTLFTDLLAEPLGVLALSGFVLAKSLS